MNKRNPDVKMILEYMISGKDPEAARAIRAFIEEHAGKELEVRGEKKVRIILVLEKLFTLAMTDIKANTMYLDRAIGKVSSARRATRKTRAQRFSRYF